MKKTQIRDWISAGAFVLLVTVPPAVATSLLGLSAWATALLTFGVITFVSQRTAA